MIELYPEEIPSSEDKAHSMPVRNITLCVTNACQLRCTYCYEHHKGNQYMSFETAKKYIDMIVFGTKGMDKFISADRHKFIVLEFIG